ncbi:MAG: Uma2 family endonuclease [Pyrinomonadaceae bacterium]
MSKALLQKSVSVAEYLALEERSKLRHEYCDGEVLLMAGASRRHSRIASNIGGELFGQLRKKTCEVHYGDLRLRVRKTHYVYGDVSIFCGEPELEVYKDTETLLNPKVVFEVLSKSTEARDRGDKAEDYRQLASLSDYLFVSQNKMLVEHYSRQKDESWKLIEYRDPNAKVKLISIGCELNLSDIYAGIKLPQLQLVKKNK